MATPYDDWTKEQLIAGMVDRDDQIAQLKADANTKTILQNKIDKLAADILTMQQRKQALPNISQLLEIERNALSTKYQELIDSKTAEKTKLETVLAGLP